jgi:uncharacterized protein YcbK (DUF882 family)
VKTKQLTKNFNISEFKCKDGTDVPDELENNVQELANNLQIIRDKFCIEIGVNMPLIILSGYRSPKHNAKVKGAKNSQHLLAKASDITLKDKSLLQHLYILIKELIDTEEIKAGGITFYREKGFIHYDIRGVKVTWKT